VERADVSDRESLRSALYGPEGAGGHRPVGGVVHLAGALADALLTDLRQEDLERTFAGKADGAWHLHELTRGEPLAFFVLFSSLAGLVGSPGQAAYAAANTALDALACHRAALGLPGQSIAWGTWAGASLAETGGGTDRLAARGVPPLDPDTGVALLEEALRGGRPQLAAAALAPAELAAGGVWPAARGLLAPLLPQTTDGGTGPAGPRPGAAREEILAGETPAQRRQAMVDFLSGQVGHVLGAQPGAVAADTPFQSLGLDSLMAVELRGRLEAALGVRLSATLVYAHPTTGALADQLLARLTGERAADPGPDHPAAAPHPAAADLSELDDAEVAALLAAEIDAFDEGGES
jgi:myxalamid-type polyketide synthase MxaE and MxaD